VRHNVLIVDDHPIIRRGLAALIGSEPDFHVSGEASTAEEAVEALGRGQHDLAIVDLSLGDTSGLDLIKQVRSRDERIKILVLSIHDETIYADRCLRAGAMGYVSKQEPAEILIEALRRIASGRIHLSPRMADRILGRLVQGEWDASRSPVSALSDRELEIFELIGRGMTTRQIAETLHLSTKTIDTYRENIKSKLGIENGPALIQRAVLWLREEA
jgi:DNA-binding NarL/FixJ family response regulator